MEPRDLERVNLSTANSQSVGRPQDGRRNQSGEIAAWEPLAPTREPTRPARRVRLPIPTPGNWKAGGRSGLQQGGRILKKKICKEKKINLNQTKLQARRSPPKARWGRRGRERPRRGEWGIRNERHPLQSRCLRGLHSARSHPQETDKTEPVVRRFVPVPKALRGEGSEQRRQRLVCQGGIRSACPGAPAPTFPRPARAARARDLWGDARGFESRFGSLRTTCAHGLRRGRLGECPGREGGHAAGKVLRRRPSPPTLAGGAGQNGPTQLLPAPWGRKRSAPAGARGRRRPFHTRPGILLFLTAHQGKA
ncbi:uncharacterized protein LOC116569981 [Mustela erminea]|uniref:uncharacterized protein LOC116569981 n=1 Tax=Mustela erminea TaxID=36723 RepID=UPI0013870D7A|nr:uncharacterized protein LOC116569981 [Mustela erminea]